MTEAQLPLSVVNRDKQLTSAVESSARTLAQLRWEWTLNEKNPNRVSFREYARQVMRDHKQISVYARAFALTRETAGLSVSEALIRAQLGAASLVAAEAVAEARDIPLTTVRNRHYDEMRVVRDEAQARAELRGTSVVDEARDIARRLASAAEREKQQHKDRAERTVLRSDLAATRLVSARRSVLDALEQLRDVELQEEDVAVLNDRLDKLEAAVGLMRARVRGESGVNWDIELRDLLEVG